jgi:hypothetical protein
MRSTRGGKEAPRVSASLGQSGATRQSPWKAQSRGLPSRFMPLIAWLVRHAIVEMIRQEAGRHAASVRLTAFSIIASEVQQSRGTSAVSLNCRNIPRSQQPSPRWGRVWVGVTVPLQRRRKEGHPIPASHFCFKKVMLVPALMNGPDFWHSRVASGDLADITPTQPSPIHGGFQDVWRVGV